MAKYSSLYSGYNVRFRVVSALDTLLREYDYKKITIRLICEEAGISHQTFYRYFKDKYAIAEWYFDVQAESSLLEIGKTLTWQEGAEKFTSNLNEERNFFAAVLSENSDYNSLKRYIVRRMMQIITETLLETIGVIVTESMTLKLEARWYMGVEIGTMRLLNNPMMPPDTFSVILSDCTSDEIRTLMDDHVLQKRTCNSNSQKTA